MEPLPIRRTQWTLVHESEPAAAEQGSWRTLKYDIEHNGSRESLPYYLDMVAEDLRSARLDGYEFFWVPTDANHSHSRHIDDFLETYERGNPDSLRD